MRRFLFIGTALSCVLCSFETYGLEDCAFVQSPYSEYKLATYSMDEITPLFPALQEKVEAAFVKYPYLWVPPQGEIYKPNQLLVSEKNGFVTVVRKGEEVVGVAAGANFDSDAVVLDLGQDVVERARENGFDPSKLFYMCYFLIDPAHYNSYLVQMIYNEYASFARASGKTQMCYLEACDQLDHPLRPESLDIIEPWGTTLQGCKSMNIKMEHAWPTLQTDGSVQDETHTIEFFVKDLE